jgi:hypothetical protein
LQDVFPTEGSRPDYICIDKACQVLRTAVSNGSWDTWKKTSRFIVDSYHYTNHRATDELCRKYCNPAPTDGSAPNLVGQKVDTTGVVHDVREFNTQTCEQLNAWLGGFESILKRMTSKNFNWFLHVMLFYHVKHILAKISVPLVADNPDDDHGDNDSQDEELGNSSDQESSSSSEAESTSSSDDESTSSSDDESTSSNDDESISSGIDDVGLSSDDDNNTEETTTTSDDEDLIEDTNDEMIEDEDEGNEDEMEVDD